ncbi:D-hexose-6-phosphate mutarotase [Ferrimonas gelatinilytica]|uniref:Putative glucose-6-phosphate 1-epimerase n=1 Tax=Ferrimonas gelatinilytica TaxID=1255257 RepID=A0ABP9S1J3_9GAMM
MSPTSPITLRAGDSEIIACRFGAHLLSWRHRGQEQLWLSSNADLGGQHPIRGGVPLCFPWFGGAKGGPSHGFARTSLWELTSNDASSGRLQFELSDSPQTRALWPHRFHARMEIQCDTQGLQLELTIENRDNRPWSFTGALHSYFACEDVTQVLLPELTSRPFHDKLSGQEAHFDAGALPIPIDAVVPGLDRVQLDNRIIRNQGNDATVIWNPGQQGAAAMPDITPGHWRHFLCIESAVARSPVTLAPGQRHRLAQRVLPASHEGGH